MWPNDDNPRHGLGKLTRQLDVNRLIMPTIAVAVQVAVDGIGGQLARGFHHGPEINASPFIEAEDTTAIRPRSLS